MCHISLQLVQESCAMEGRLVSNGITDALLRGMSDLRAIKKDCCRRIGRPASLRLVITAAQF